MDGNTTLYEIHFRYCDNHELYQLQVLLTASEFERVSKFLLELLRAGCIEAADRTDPDAIEYLIYEPTTRKPTPFKELKKLWKGGTLLRMAGEHEIKF